ncbi:glutamate receptor ionotropic, delta-2-like [Palaemon carinicauda]|uniref:glutamate receptor ionotropic, delta-2-like n=1 Tax=Palaemon carinicauda TaxID=392227 RepID=UPI0035B5A93A
MASRYQEFSMVPGLQWYSFNMFRNIVVQGNYIKTQAWSTRILIFAWFVFCLIISALYSGMLTAVLAVPAFEKPIDSLSDLPRAVREGFTLGVLADTTNEYIFKTSTGGIYKQTWNLFNHKDRSKSFVSSPQIGMTRVLEGKFVFILGDAFAEVLATKMGRRRFYFGRDYFAYVNVGIACQTGAPYVDIFSDVLLRLGEGGLIHRWLEYEKTKGREEATSKDASETKTIAITLTHLQDIIFGPEEEEQEHVKEEQEAEEEQEEEEAKEEQEQ